MCARVELRPQGEIRAMASLLLDRRILFLMPLFACSTFQFAFVFSALNGQLFTVRTAGLNAACFWAVAMAASARVGEYHPATVGLGRVVCRPICTGLLLDRETLGSCAWRATLALVGVTV